MEFQMLSILYFLLVYFLFGIGVFSKLKHYGAPNSSFWYAGAVPFISLWKFFRAHLTSKEAYCIKSMRHSLKILFTGMCKWNLINAAICCQLGHYEIKPSNLLEYLPLRIGFDDDILTAIYEI